MNDECDLLIDTEQARVQSLLDADVATFQELHDDAYRLCNPTGTTWGKAEYLDLLTSGRLVYQQLSVTGRIDVLRDRGLAVLRYRCTVALRIDGADIPPHELWHTDVYIKGLDGRWRCRWSQATGILPGSDAHGAGSAVAV